MCDRGVGNVVKNPCHFLKIKSRFIRNNPACPHQLVPEFIAQSTDCELSPSHVNMSLGHDCYKLDVFRALPANILEKKKMFLLQKCYYLITLQIKKDQRTLPTKFDLVMLFLHFQKRHWVQARPCFTFCAYNVGVFHRGKSN